MQLLLLVLVILLLIGGLPTWDIIRMAMRPRASSRSS